MELTQATRARDWILAAERELPLAPDLVPLLGSNGSALVLAPHPDDESLGCGGLIARCAAESRTVRVVVISDGAGSHQRSRAWPPSRLAAQRRQETRQAVATLGLDPLRDLLFLDLPDGAVPTVGERFDRAVGVIRSFAAGSSAIFASWRHDPHTDHTATFAIASAVAQRLGRGTRLFAYPVWGLAFAHPIAGFPLPVEPGFATPASGVRLDVSRHLAAKRRAIAAHASQTTSLISDDPDGFRLPKEMMALVLRPYEMFLEERTE